MGKTELALLEKLASAPHGKIAVIHGCRIGRGKPDSYGAREANAVCKLRDKGLIRVVSVERYRDCRNTYSDHWIETVIEKV